MSDSSEGFRFFLDPMFLFHMAGLIGFVSFLEYAREEQKQIREACIERFNHFASKPDGKAALDGTIVEGRVLVDEYNKGKLSIDACTKNYAILKDKGYDRYALVDMKADENDAADLAYMQKIAAMQARAMRTSGFSMSYNTSSGTPSLTFSLHYDDGYRSPSRRGQQDWPVFISPSPSMSRCARVYKVCDETPDPSDVLRKLQQIEIGKWKYIDEGDTAVSHISPYAEDFHATFGVGDGKTLHWVDVMGVMMSSMQGLMQEVQTLRAELAEAKNPQKYL